MIIDNLKLKKKYLDDLIYFHQKIEEIKQSTLYQKYLLDKESGHYSVQAKKVKNLKDGSWLIRDQLVNPPEEVIKAFILDLRFFIQDNERISLSHLGEQVFPHLENQFPEEVQAFTNLRNNLNEFLNSKPGINLKYQSGSLKKEFETNGEILETNVYGHFAHGNIKKNQKTWYDIIHSHTDEGIHSLTRNMFRFVSLGIFGFLTILLIEIDKIVGKILEKLVDHHYLNAEKLMNNGDIRKSERYFQNLLYIVDKIGNRDQRAQLYKRLGDNYAKMGEENKSKRYEGKYKDVMDSLRVYDIKFWNEKYYRDYYSIPKEYLKIIKKANSNYEEIARHPIIILPLERLHEAQKFCNLIVAKNFRLSERNLETRKVSLYYELRVAYQNDESLWYHYTFDFDPENDFICKFPFRDFSGILFITNSPKLFIRGLLEWIQKAKFMKSTKNYLRFGIMIELLCYFEVHNTLSSTHDSLLKKFNLLSIEELRNFPAIFTSVENQKAVFQSMGTIFQYLIDLTVLPRLKNIIDLDNYISDFKVKAITPHLERSFKGQAKLSFNLAIIKFTLISGDDIFLISKELIELKDICSLIYGRIFTEEFFTRFFDYCIKCLLKYETER
jgi:hypothetical protein